MQSIFPIRQITESISVILTAEKGTISSTAKDAEAQSVYEMYYEFEEPVKKAGRTSVCWR